MAVLINFKICDNAKECGGIEVCKTGALSWDEKKQKIKIDNTKCVSCGRCMKMCPVQAIFVARNTEEYTKIDKEIKKDKRKISDLFIDKYGAAPLHPGFIYELKNFKADVLESTKTVMVEIYSDDSLRCLLRSIPLKEIVSHKSMKFCKINIGKDRKVMEKYGITKLPSLMFFKEGKIIGKIQGYYDVDKKNDLKEKIQKILKKD